MKTVSPKPSLATIITLVDLMLGISGAAAKCKRCVTMLQKLLTVFLAGLLLGTVLPAAAHHSRPAHYLVEERLTIEGEIMEFQWRNPHCFIFLKVTDNDGNAETWKVEARSTPGMMRQGLTPDTFKRGDHVRVTGMPARAAAQGLLFMRVVWPDGREVINEQVEAEIRGQGSAPARGIGQ